MNEEFPLYHVLGVTHALPMLGVDYQAILKYLTGQTLSPVQALSVRDTCREWLLEQHPALRDVPPCPRFEQESIEGEAAMDAWCDEQATRLGVQTLTLTPVPVERLDTRSDMERMLDHVDPAKVYIHNPDS